MLTKELSDVLKSAQTASSLSGLSTLLVNSLGELVKIGKNKLLASMFTIGSADVVEYNAGNSAMRATWLTYIKRSSDTWAISSASVMDSVVISGRTQDTNQSVVYYATVTEKISNTHIKVKPFLLLLEGEPPIWASMSL